MYSVSKIQQIYYQPKQIQQAQQIRVQCSNRDLFTKANNDKIQVKFTDCSQVININRRVLMESAITVNIYS